MQSAVVKQNLTQNVENITHINMKSKTRTKIDKIEISGYKSISAKHPLYIKMSDVNILLGANGAGKTNIISFFRMLNFMMTGTLQKYVAQHGTNTAMLHYGPKITPIMEGHIELSNENGKDYYDLKLAAAAANQLIVSEEKITWEKANTENPPYTSVLKSTFLESALVESHNSTAGVIRNMLANCKAFQFHDSSQNGALRQASLKGAAQYLQSEGNNLASFLLYLRDNHRSSYARIVEYVKMILPSFGDFYLEPDNGYVSLNWTDNSPNDYVFTSDQFSDGTIRFIALATLLLQPEKTMPNVIIIDEPELGLHPYAIGVLAEMIRDASLHAQIIISTQSTLLIDEFSADCITVIEHNEEEGFTTAKRLDEEQLKGWLDDYSISELWTKNVIGGQPL